MYFNLGHEGNRINVNTIISYLQFDVLKKSCLAYYYVLVMIRYNGETEDFS